MKASSPLTLLTAATLLCFASASSYGTLILSESFDYSPIGGSIAGNGGSVDGFTGAWTTPGDSGLIAAGLTDPLIAGGASGNAWRDDAGSTNYTDERTFDDTELWNGDGEAWFAFLIDVDTQTFTTNIIFGTVTGSNDAGFGVRIDSGGLEAQVAGKDSGMINLTNPSGTRLVLGRLTFFDNNTDDIVDIWVDPTDVSSVAALGAPLATDAENIVAADQGSILRINGDNGPVFTIDEIRLGTELSDVVIPEPASLALLGMGGLLMLRRQAR